MLITDHSYFAMALASYVIPAVAQGQPVPVIGLATGINPITGERPARKNVNDLQAAGGPACRGPGRTDEKTRDLYILGLSELQNKSESDPLSYFQISGIHGRPFIPWNGVENFTVSENDTMGFCPHDSSASYKAAAKSFRIPYWDWAADYRLPASVIDQRITTKREPDENGRNQYDVINNALASAALQDQVTPANEKKYRVFTSAKDYETMASTQDKGASFEGPHDNVHMDIGAIMYQTDYSAFDPIFWLHHANVDRLFALWQAVYYNNTYQTQSRTMDGGLYATPPGNVTGDSPLKPFYRGDDPTSFHTGKTAAAITTFGYTYPRSTTGRSRARRRASRSSHSNGTNGLVSAQQRGGGASAAHRRARRGQQATKKKEYYAQISVERSELQLPCTLSVMLGDDKAGQMSLLSMPTSGITHAEVPLTRAVGRALASDTAAKNNNVLASDAAFVAARLGQLFRMEIRKADGTVIPIESVPSLSVQVEGEDVVVASHIEEFPKYGAVTRLPGVGLGKLARRDAATRL
ncbi:hypothetical protein PG994_006336 [Apiospora phragmitis]|uniref:tyrosinase n=1 Tax=Apiospora phragmitis TaxID=2905665 RepID=A0ABR1VET8_9PEZI